MNKFNTKAFTSFVGGFLKTRQLEPVASNPITFTTFALNFGVIKSVRDHSLNYESECSKSSLFTVKHNETSAVKEYDFLAGR